jgi:hypothetical protein
MRLLADQLAPALEVDTPGRDQRIIGPQPRFLVADVAGEAERRVEKAARSTVEDWLDLLASAQPERERNTPSGQAQRTLVLAVLRGALLDLLATDDLRRTTAAVRSQLHALTPSVR